MALILSLRLCVYDVGRKGAASFWTRTVINFKPLTFNFLINVIIFMKPVSKYKAI